MSTLTIEPTKSMSIDDLLTELNKQEQNLRDQLRTDHQKLDDKINPSLSLIDRTRKELADVDNIPPFSYSKIVNPNPYNWFITFPSQFTEGKMTYSQQQFEQFNEAIELGNNTMDKLIEIYKEHGKKYILDRALKGNLYNFAHWDSIKDDAGGHPIRISWKTFALPNLLDHPVLGKQVYFEHAIDREHGHLQGKEYRFRIGHTKDGIKPFFSCECDYSGSYCDAFSEMDEIIKKLNLPNFIADDRTRSLRS